MSKHMISNKFQPQPGPGRLWGMNDTTGLSSLKQGEPACICQPSAVGCWPSSVTSQMRQFLPVEGTSPEKGADKSRELGEGSTYLLKGLWTELTVNGTSQGTAPAAPWGSLLHLPKGWHCTMSPPRQRALVSAHSALAGPFTPLELETSEDF